MTDITIWHNPRCSKSRATLHLLQANGIAPTQRKYLEDPPSADEIKHALSALGMTASELVRRGETVYKELNLSTASSEDALITAMTDNPILIERPVVIAANKAALGRPPENVLTLLP